MVGPASQTSTIVLDMDGMFHLEPGGAEFIESIQSVARVLCKRGITVTINPECHLNDDRMS
jgi:hypothetical protein